MKQKFNYLGNQNFFTKNKFILIAILVSVYSTAWSATYRWNDNKTSGNWNTSGNWQKNTTGNTYEDTTEIPGEADLIYIRGSKSVTITIPSDYEAKCKTLCTNSDSGATGNIEIIINGKLSIIGTADKAGGNDNTPTLNTSGLITNGGANNSGNTIITVNNDCNFSNIYIESLGSNHPGSGSGNTQLNVAEGKKLYIAGRIEMSGRAKASHNSTLNILGNGLVSCAVFDTATNQNYTQTINIDTNSTFSIEEYYFGNAEKAGISMFEGTGTLKIPAAGAHMNWGSICGFTYASTLTILANEGNSYYRIAVSGLNAFPGTAEALKNITIQLQCDNLSGGTAYVYFPFKITKITNTASAKFLFDKYYTATTTTTESTDFEITTADANTIQGYFAVQAGGNRNVTKDITLSSDTATLNNADGFSIEIWTPDNARVLSSIEWYYKTPTWVGTKSTVWEDVENWAGLETGHSVATTFNTDYPNYDLKINSSATRMPVITDSQTYNLNSLTITPNASFTINNGTLNVKTITVADSATKASVIQNGGTLQIEKLELNGSSTFTGNGTGTLKPQTNTLILNANIPENMILAGLTISAGATVTCPQKLYLTGDLSDAGTFLTIPEVYLQKNFDQTVEPNGSTTYTKIFIDKNSGTVTFDTNNLKTADFTVTNASDIVFEKALESTSFTVTTANDIVFEKALKTTNFTVTKADSTTFNDDATINSITDTVSSGDFFFNKTASINSDTSFLTAGEVTFGNEGSDNIDFGTNKISHTAGITNIYGTVKASEITVKDLTINGTSTLNTTTLNLAGDTDGKLNTASNTTLNLTGDINVSGVYSLGDSQACKITFNPLTKSLINDGTLTIPHSATINGNVINNGTIKFEGTTIKLNGDFTNNAAVEIRGNKSVAVKGTVDDSAGTGWTITGTGDGYLKLAGESDQSFIACTTPQTYKSIECNVSNNNTLTFTNPLSITNLKLTTGNIDFSDSVTVTNYLETDTPSGDITFSDDATFTKAVTFGTQGTISIASNKNLDIKNSTPSYLNFTHSNGLTKIDGSLNAMIVVLDETELSGKISASGSVNTGKITLNGTGTEISGTTITTGVINATTANTDELTLTASAGSFTTDQIGVSTNKINKVTLDSKNSDLSFTYNGSDKIYANTLNLKNNNKKITLTGTNLDGELQLNTISEITLNGGVSPSEFSVTALTFGTTPSKITLSGTILISGAAGFVIPLLAPPALTPAPPLVLSGDTTIRTTTGPITLYDNISGSKKLTIDNTGLFTLNDTTSTQDPAAYNSTVATKAVFSIFEQTGAGAVDLAGDISTTDSISFASDISLSKNVSLSSGTTISISDKISDTGTNVLVTNSTGNSDFSSDITADKIYITASNLTFNGSTAATISGTLLSVTAEDFIVNKTNPTDTIIFDLPVTTNKDLTITSGDASFNYTTELQGSFTNNSTVQNSAELKIHKDFTDSGSFIESSGSKISLIGTTDQTFTPTASTTYNQIYITKNLGDLNFNTNKLVATNLTAANVANLNFNKDTEISSLSIEKAASTNFYGTTTITTITDTANAGTINFLADTNISSNTTLLTTSEVTFGNEVSNNFAFGLTSPYFSLTHTAGKTKISGTITVGNIELADTECNTNTTINCSTFTLGKNLTKSSSTNWIKINGNLNTTASNITISPNLILDGSFSNTNLVTLNQSLYIYNANPNPGSINLNKLKITDDLVFDSPRTITCSDNITANNIVLYNGNLTTTSTTTLKSLKDIILLGSAYTTDIDSEKYNQSRLSATNYTRTDFTAPAKMPDDTPLSTVGNFSGTYKAAGGTKLFASKNFYANGITFSSSDNTEWFIDIPDIRDANNGFAETYNCSVAYSTIRCHNNTDSTTDDTSDGSQAQMPAYNCTDLSNNLNWLFDDLEIVQAYTVRDDVIYLEFNRPLRNKNGEINGDSGSISEIKYNNNTKEFDKIYTTADCSTEVSASENITNASFYIHAKSSWNTDATGTTSGNAKSTDKKGLHNSVIVDLTIPKTALSDMWGKKIANYTGAAKYTATEDKTGPVLYSVRTGQEMHVIPTGTPESQHSYDAHNFIEFRYSEPVDFGSTDASQCDVYIPAYSAPDTPNITENIQVTDKFGALQGNITTQGPLNFVGLAKISDGKIHTGSNGTTNKYINSLYRQDEYSIRISVAGYTNGTVIDGNGNEYKKWEGYIESASLPTGEVTLTAETNNLVSDQNGNKQIRYKNTENFQNPSVNSAEGELDYGKWDISAPIFAPLHMNVTNIENQRTWKQDLLEGIYQSEAIGNNSGVGSTLDRIEFHILDNTPDFTRTDLPEWVSEIGWCENGSDGTKEKLYNGGRSSDFYCADIFGGARQFNTSTNRTSGGVRYCSVYNAASAFKYINRTDRMPTTNFDNGVATYTGANAIIFTGTSQPRRSAMDLDGLYFGLSLGASGTYDIKTTFTVSYDDSLAYITDLAGNRLKSQTFTTIDRTPPSFDITISPINNDEIFITFVKQLITNSSNLSFTKDDGTNINVSQTGSFESILPNCFKIISIDENGTPADSTTVNIDTSRPAQILSKSNSNFTCVKLYLTEKVTLEDVKNLYIQLVAHPDYTALARDPLTNHTGAKVTFIQDTNKNFMEIYTAHALSDFAVNPINPLYAYDETMSEETTDIMNNLYGTDSWAVHDWSEEQKNYGTLPANHELAIVCGITDGTSAATNLPQNVKIYLSDNPTKGSVSTQYNADLKENLRVWLPNTSSKVFSSLSEKNNKNFITADSQLITEDKPKDGIIFHLPTEITSKWKSNSQISFLFGLMDENNEPINIIHSPELDLNTEGTYLPSSAKYPLFALRLKNPSDISSLDLWSFKIKNITEQRGGVTILNNVINNTLGEKTIIKVDLAEESRLNVIVMTLDGNVVKYLNRGRTQAGEHYFYWDGTNTNNKPVARGIYFVRISANGIDETRKVIVVK